MSSVSAGLARDQRAKRGSGAGDLELRAPPPPMVTPDGKSSKSDLDSSGADQNAEDEGCGGLGLELGEDEDDAADSRVKMVGVCP